MDILQNILSREQVARLLNEGTDNFTKVAECINKHCTIGNVKYNISVQTISQISKGTNKSVSIPSLIALTWFFDNQVRKISKEFKSE